MAKIDNFIYCLNVDRAPENQNIVIIKGISCSLSPDFIPGNFTFAIAFSVLDIDEGDHDIKIQFVNPQGEVVANVDDIKINYKQENNIPKEWKGINITLSLNNVVLQSEGIYKTIVFFDGENLSEKEIYIAKKE